MKIYISYPISGYDINERIEYGKNVSKIVSEKFPESEILTPFGMCPYDPNRSYGDCMKECLKNLYESDSIILCTDWIKSSGCREEYFIACNHDINIYETDGAYVQELGPGVKEKYMLQCAIKSLNK
jgi:hypothetical protein